MSSPGEKTPVDNPDRGQGPGIPDVLSGKVWIAEMTCGGVPGKLATRTEMRVHFVHRHVLDTVVMLEEGNFPHPRSARCDMQVPWRALNGRHPGTAQCAKGAERKIRRLAETEMRENSERSFKAYGEPMEAVSEFKYLGRILTETDKNWPAVAGNIKKAR